MTSRVNCKYHPDANLIEDYRAGDTICGDCGMVVGDRYQYFLKYTSVILTAVYFLGY